jgi:hypothetical protein
VRTLALLDPDAERLRVVAALVRRVLERDGLDIEVVETGDPRSAVASADAVLLQLRAGCKALDDHLHALLAADPGLPVVLPPEPPVVGAVLLAAELVGIRYSPAGLARQVRATLDRPAAQGSPPTRTRTGGL